jgi:succinyl-CoA synthetase alpha subunit
VALVLERNNAVELKPSMEDLFEAVRKVCEDVMAITENLPRLAMLGTARQLKELEVILSGAAAASSVLLELL